MTDFVSKYAPSVREDCGDVYWSHPAFKGGFGEPIEYLIYVNGGDPVPYTPGEEILVAEDGAAWQVTLKAKYEGLSFEHQLGQHKGQGEVCVVIPPKPDVEWRETVTEAAPDCETVSVEVTTVKEAAGYWWNDEAWVLGSFQPVSEETTSREATTEECPVPVEEPEEVDELETPTTPGTESPVAPEEVVQVAKPAPVKLDTADAVLETVAIESTESEIVTSEPELAATGADIGYPIALGITIVAAALSLLWKGRKA